MNFLWIVITKFETFSLFVTGFIVIQAFQYFLFYKVYKEYARWDNYDIFYFTYDSITVLSKPTIIFKPVLSIKSPFGFWSERQGADILDNTSAFYACRNLQQQQQRRRQQQRHRRWNGRHSETGGIRLLAVPRQLCASCHAFKYRPLNSFTSTSLALICLIKKIKNSFLFQLQSSIVWP